jgi:hypothetical protein
MSGGGDAASAGGGALSGTGWIMTRWLRSRWLAVVPLLLIVGIGTTGTMLAFGTSQRTSDAYGRYLERAHVGDVVLNPSVRSTEIDAVIRSLPGVTRVTTDSLFLVTADDGRPRTRAEVEEAGEQGGVAALFGSHDGRYADMDRPVVQSGRLPTGPAEAAISATSAEAQELELGDVIPLAFWRPGLADGLSAEATAAFAAEVVPPIGVEHVELVGLLTFADEVLPNELHNRHRGIVSPDVAQRYDCLPPPPDPALSLAENIEINLPEGCAVSYRYYSLSFADGAAGVKPALEEFVRRARPLNAEMARIRDTSGQGSAPPQYFLISTETQAERDRVERAIRPTVAALTVLGVAAAIVTLGLAGLAVAREVRHTRAVQRQWHQLGMARAPRTVVGAAPLVVATALGLAVGAVAAFAIGSRPIGVVGVLEDGRSPGISHTGLLAAVAIAVGVVAWTLVLVARSMRPEGVARSGRRTGVARPWWRVGPPAVADGVRAAVARGSWPAIAGTGIVSAAFVASLVFGSNLARLVETPRSYGWPWDVAAMTGGGYGDLDLPAAQQALDGDPAVAAWTAFGFLNEVSLDGEPTMSVVGIERETPEVDFPVLEGDLPSRADEVAVGIRTAHERDIEVGDTVTIGGGSESIEASVTGLLVFPTIGPMFAGSVGGGEGMLVPQAMIESASPETAADLATFVGVDLSADAGATDVARIEAGLQSIDLLGYPPLFFDDPVRPPEVIEADSTRSVPITVGASLAVVGLAGLGTAAWASMRSRRHDLAVLQALGFRPRQVHTSVSAQSVAVAVAALAFGVPLGVVAGRLSWQAFARQLGVVPTATNGVGTVVIVVVVTLLLAVVVAQLPAHRAAATAPAAGLRTE